MAMKVGVRCASCGRGIEAGESYVAGVRAVELSKGLCQHASVRAQMKVPPSGAGPWRKTLTCQNPRCRETHTCESGDLRLYED